MTLLGLGVPKRFYQYLAAIAVNIGFLACGMHWGWSSTAIPLLTSGNYTFQITDSEGSWLVSMLPVGSFFGDMIAAALVDILGRKKLIMFSTLPLALSWVLISLAPSAPYMFVGRFIAGVSDGVAFTSIPSYLAEVSDPEVRGFMCSTYPVTLFLGMLLMSIFQFFLSMNNSCYVAASIILCSYLIVPWIPESPYFYLMKNNEADATISLQKFTGTTDVSEHVSRINKGLLEEQSQKGGFKDLFSSSLNIRTLILCLLLCAAQQLCGITAVQSYTTQVFKQSSDIMDPTAANLAFFGLILVGSVISLILVDNIGRKKLLISSMGLTILFLAVNGIYAAVSSSGDTNLQYIPFTATLLYAFAFSTGANTIPTMVVSEILPSHVKGAGLCLSNFTFSIFSTLTVNYFT